MSGSIPVEAKLSVRLQLINSIFYAVQGVDGVI